MDGSLSLTRKERETILVKQSRCASNSRFHGIIYESSMIMSHFIVFLQKVVPHITDAIQEWIERVAMVPVDGKEGPADVCVIELGGTIGESKFYAASMQAFYALHL